MIADQQKAGNKVGMILHKIFAYITLTLHISFHIKNMVGFLYHPFLVSLLYADLLSLHLVTIFVFNLVYVTFFASSRLTF